MGISASGPCPEHGGTTASLALGEEKARVFQVQDSITGIEAGAVEVKDREQGLEGMEGPERVPVHVCAWG